MVDPCTNTGFRNSDTLAVLIFVFRGSFGFDLTAARWFASPGFDTQDRSHTPLVRLHDFNLLSRLIPFIQLDLLDFAWRTRDTGSTEDF